MRIDPFPVPLSLLFPLSPRCISILWGCNLILGRDLGREGMGGAKERSHDIGGGRGRLRTEVEEGSWREKSGKTTLASVAALCSLSTQPPAVVAAVAAASPQLFMSSTLLSPRLALCWRVERGSLSLSSSSPLFALFSFWRRWPRKRQRRLKGRAKGPTDGRRAEKKKKEKRSCICRIDPPRSPSFIIVRGD